MQTAPACSSCCLPERLSQTPASGPGSAAGMLSRAKDISTAHYGTAPRRKAHCKQPGLHTGISASLWQVGQEHTNHPHYTSSQHPVLQHGTAQGAQGDPESLQPVGPSLWLRALHSQQRRYQLISTQVQALQGITLAVFLARLLGFYI